MTYLVLARKWRPRSFETLVGQDHVVRALTHALQTQRLHHAWLFTGTRGVGKTTLSRILAKSLNCETGITPTPCGQCRACTEIDAGRFVDYLELDAASNRGVEEMTQLLEQAVYAPGAGRFKVYMIDEVHMLTGHAFNAMLKTLEEPPPHVKFILATTDPQKIPVTVLSRCLQFNLKQMPPESIVGHLQSVLAQESIPFEVPALRLVAQAAAGSMRDALSLTDQAIAYSAGNLTEDAVRGMLGTIDQRHLVRLLEALAGGDAGGVLSVADELSTRGLSYAGALADLSVLLSKVAIAQRVPGALPAEDPLTQDIVRLASVLHPDAVQLFYSVAVHSRGELTLSPDEYAGFVMACLRMLALNGDAGPATAPQSPVATPQPAAAAAVAASAAPASASAAVQAAAPAPSHVAAGGAAPAAVQPMTAPDAAASAGAASNHAAQDQAAQDQATQDQATQDQATQDQAAPGGPAPTPAPPANHQSASASAQAAATASAPVSAQAAAMAPIFAAAPDSTASPASVPQPDTAVATPAPAQAGHQTSASVAPTGLESAAPVAPAPAPARESAAQPAASAASPASVPPWEDSPSPASATFAPAPSDAPPPAEAFSDELVAAQDDGPPPYDDGPPTWVDEDIPYDADAYTPDPEDDFETLAVAGAASEPREARAPAAAPRAARKPKGTPTARLSDMSAASWPQLAARLPVTGLAAELAKQSEWLGVQGDAVVLRVAVKTLAESESRVRLQTVLCEHFGQGLRLEIEVGATGDGTAHAVAKIERAARQQAAEEAVQADPFVQALISRFGAHVVPGSVRPFDATRLH
ncbi:DNA polymerase III subunit gamma/tau [Bordetella genomosp. 13]|uniref:DNA-directed DNA polymerase n=1 Tax=Bordetella genomosp. 13 TaxID=463040 RepID=A0A1W6ZJ41_9BORD|nr:DNA polymerase III subunit gamma/tau [Bordetella genomosp. 13]ARP97438.1 DNA polymerase III subunit gamma/tau [Bordetella genomosp. 13]